MFSINYLCAHPSLLECPLRSIQYLERVRVRLTDRSTLAWLWVGFYMRTSIMRSPILLQLCICCSSYMRGLWDGWSVAVNCCFGRCYSHNLFKTARSILVLTLSSFFFCMRFVSDHVVHSYSSMATATAWMKSRFILSRWNDIDCLPDIDIMVRVFANSRETWVQSRSSHIKDSKNDTWCCLA